MPGVSRYRGPERPLPEAVGMEPDFTGCPKMLGMLESLGCLPRRAVDREWDQLKRETRVYQSTKLKGVRDLKSALTSDMEMQSSEFTQLIFGPVFPH